MWSRLDDALIDHSKIFVAGAALGKNGPGLALGLYIVGLLWTNKHLTDGHLPLDIVKALPHFEHPLTVADALLKAGLWEKNGHGFQIHDFDQLNPSAADIKKKRRADAARKREERRQ